MISQPKTVTIVYLCILLTFNDTVSNSLPNDTRLEGHETQLNFKQKDDNSETKMTQNSQNAPPLTEFLNGMKTEIIHQIDECSKYVNQSANSLHRRLDRLEMKFQEELNRRLTEETVQLINSERFREAVKKLRQSDNDTVYMHVVRDVYDNKSSNLNILLRFVETISDIELKFKIYKICYNVTVIGDFSDALKLIDLCQFLEKEILHRATGVLKVEVQAFYQMLLDAIKRTAVESLSLAFLNDSDIRELWLAAKEITKYLNRIDALLEVYRSVIEKVWTELTVAEILRKQQNRNPGIDGIENGRAIHIALVDKLERNDALWSNSTILLARDMQRLSIFADAERYRYNSPHTAAINKLPESVKNIAFSRKICIKNTLYNEYLYASNVSDPVSDGKKVRVTTWILPKDTNEPFTNNVKWQVFNQYDLQIKLRNWYFYEYLFADLDKHDTERRYTYIWRQPNDSRVSDAWNIEVHGNGIYFKNKEYGEYLVAQREANGNQTTRYALTHRGTDWMAEGKWQIDNCD